MARPSPTDTARSSSSVPGDLFVSRYIWEIDSIEVRSIDAN